jgi:hypothetical protein
MVMLTSSETTLVLWYQMLVSRTTATEQHDIYPIKKQTQKNKAERKKKDCQQLTGVAGLHGDFHRLALVETFGRRLQRPEFLSTDLRLPRGQTDVVNLRSKTKLNNADSLSHFHWTANQ